MSLPTPLYQTFFLKQIQKAGWQNPRKASNRVRFN